MLGSYIDIRLAYGLLWSEERTKGVKGQDETLSDWHASSEPMEAHLKFVLANGRGSVYRRPALHWDLRLC